MQSYSAARTYFGILGFLSWTAIVIGGIVGISTGVALQNAGGPPMAGLLGILPMAAIMFAGLVGLVLTQIARAGVDSAEFAQQSLKIAREQLEISKQGLKQQSTLEQNYAALIASKPELPNSLPTGFQAAATLVSGTPEMVEENNEPTANQSTDTISYKGHTISVDDGSYRFNNIFYRSLELAKAKVDEFELALSPQPENSTPDTEKVAVDPGASDRQHSLV